MSEYSLVTVAIVFFMTLSMNLFWYSLGCVALMRIGGWEPRRGPALVGKPLGRRVLQAAVLVTVVTAVLDVMGRGILTARSHGLDGQAVVSLVVIFIAVMAVTWAVMGLGLNGSSLLAGGMTLVTAVTWLFIYAAFGGDDGSNPAPIILAFAVVGAVLSVVVLRSVARWMPGEVGKPVRGARTKTG